MFIHNIMLYPAACGYGERAAGAGHGAELLLYYHVYT